MSRLSSLRPRLPALLTLAAALALVFAAPAFGDAWTPESGGSSNADDIDTLYKITLYVAIVIFLIGLTNDIGRLTGDGFGVR